MGFEARQAEKPRLFFCSDGMNCACAGFEQRCACACVCVYVYVTACILIECGEERWISLINGGVVFHLRPWRAFFILSAENCELGIGNCVFLSLVHSWSLLLHSARHVPLQCVMSSWWCFF
jgi:hypothetical protein